MPLKVILRGIPILVSQSLTLEKRGRVVFKKVP